MTDDRKSILIKFPANLVARIEAVQHELARDRMGAIIELVERGLTTLIDDGLDDRIILQEPLVLEAGDILEGHINKPLTLKLEAPHAEALARIRKAFGLCSNNDAVRAMIEKLESRIAPDDGSKGSSIQIYEPHPRNPNTKVDITKLNVQFGPNAVVYGSRLEKRSKKDK